jgi:hypothetical protein
LNASLTDGEAPHVKMGSAGFDNPKAESAEHQDSKQTIRSEVASSASAMTHAVIDDLVPGRARQRHDDGQCARTEYPCSDTGLEPTPPEVIAALRAEIAAFDASVTETGNG